MISDKMIKLSMIAATTIMFTACASTPKTTEMVKEAPVAEAPVLPLVEEVPEVVVVDNTPAEVVDTSPVITGLVAGSVDDFVANAGDRIFFGYNQYSLSNDARNVLRSQAQWLNNFPQVIAVIGGHADERGTREYNLALGARRADAVKDFLVSQGVDPSRVTTVSYGKERPIDGRSNEQAWALNRNGHTALVSGTNS